MDLHISKQVFTHICINVHMGPCMYEGVYVPGPYEAYIFYMGPEWAAGPGADSRAAWPGLM